MICTCDDMVPVCLVAAVSQVAAHCATALACCVCTLCCVHSLCNLRALLFQQYSTAHAHVCGRKCMVGNRVSRRPTRQRAHQHHRLHWEGSFLSFSYRCAHPHSFPHSLKKMNTVKETCRRTERSLSTCSGCSRAVRHVHCRNEPSAEHGAVRHSAASTLTHIQDTQRHDAAGQLAPNRALPHTLRSTCKSARLHSRHLSHLVMLAYGSMCQYGSTVKAMKVLYGTASVTLDLYFMSSHAQANCMCVVCLLFCFYRSNHAAASAASRFTAAEQQALLRAYGLHKHNTLRK